MHHPDSNTPPAENPPSRIELPDAHAKAYSFPVPHTALRLVPLPILRETLKYREIAALSGVHMSAPGLMERNQRHIYGLYCQEGLKLYEIKMVKHEPCDIPRDLPITIAY